MSAQKEGKRAGRLPIRLVERGRTSFAAMAGKRCVGFAGGWMDSRGAFCIIDVMVDARYRRQGIATMLYAPIEAAAGRELVPAVSTSEDAFAFWKAYRPQAVANDLRHRKDALMGAKVMRRGRLATVTQVSGGSVTARYDDSGERDSTCVILARELDEALEMATWSGGMATEAPCKPLASPSNGARNECTAERCGEASALVAC